MDVIQQAAAAVKYVKIDEGGKERRHWRFGGSLFKYSGFIHSLKP